MVGRNELLIETNCPDNQDNFLPFLMILLTNWSMIQISIKMSLSMILHWENKSLLILESRLTDSLIQLEEKLQPDVDLPMKMEVEVIPFLVMIESPIIWTRYWIPKFIQKYHNHFKIWRCSKSYRFFHLYLVFVEGDFTNPEDVVCTTWTWVYIGATCMIFLVFSILVVCVLCIYTNRRSNDQGTKSRHYLNSAQHSIVNGVSDRGMSTSTTPAGVFYQTQATYRNSHTPG